MSERPKIRLVRCPKCQIILPEIPGCQLYQCGGCGALLRAQSQDADVAAFSEKSNEEKIGDPMERLSDRYKKSMDVLEEYVTDTSDGSERSSISSISKGIEAEIVDAEAMKSSSLQQLAMKGMVHSARLYGVEYNLRRLSMNEESLESIPRPSSMTQEVDPYTQESYLHELGEDKLVEAQSNDGVQGDKQKISHETELPMVLPYKSYVKECIFFCSVFPSDYEFTKDMLVWQWIAEGLVKLDEDEIMEEACIQCFDILLEWDYIVSSGSDHFFDQMKYKVGDRMTSLLQELTLEPNFQKYLDTELINVAKVEHLTLAFKKIDQINFEKLKKCRRLQTLVIHRCYGFKVNHLPFDLFVELYALKILNLSHTDIAILPSSIENLKELRHLDMSETPIRWLTESIRHFSNLLTLKLDGCLSLVGLPKCTNKLINLRHLVLDVAHQLESMPIGIGKLSKLRTLGAFLVGEDDGTRIGELKDMNKLKGSLRILNLENVMSKEEAEEACLCNKKDLEKIELRWNDDHDEIKNPAEDEILESLQPPLGIQELKIFYYSGGVLPSWISNPSLNDLVSIVLYRCRYCDTLPSLGELPSLKFLNIIENNVATEIDEVFCRKQNNDQHHVAFPKLEKLSLNSMSRLEKWTGLKNGDFPYLNHLILEYCPKFVCLPILSHLTSLVQLEIRYCPELSCLPEGGLPAGLEALTIKDCPKLKERCCNEGCEDWSKVAHVPSFYINNRKVSQ